MTPAVVDPRLLVDDRSALRGARCGACGEVRFPVAPLCSGCQGTDVHEVLLSRTGTVHTYAVVHASPPGYLGDVPYAVGIVDLPDGLRVTTTLVADDAKDLRVGVPCRFETVVVGDGPDAVTSFAYRCGGVAS